MPERAHRPAGGPPSRGSGNCMASGRCSSWSCSCSGSVHLRVRRPKYLFPAPSQVALSLRDDWSAYLAPATWVTEEIVVGFAIAVVAGVGLAVVLHLFRARCGAPSIRC